MWAHLVFTLLHFSSDKNIQRQRDTSTTQAHKYWLVGILSANICSREATTLTTVWEEDGGICHCAPQPFKDDGPVVYSAAAKTVKWSGPIVLLHISKFAIDAFFLLFYMHCNSAWSAGYYSHSVEAITAIEVSFSSHENLWGIFS